MTEKTYGGKTLEELEALAMAVTMEEMEELGNDWFEEESCWLYTTDPKWGEYIKLLHNQVYYIFAVGPSTVLAMVERIRTLESEVERLRKSSTSIDEHSCQATLDSLQEGKKEENS